MLPQWISRRLVEPLPGPQVQRRMAPPHAYGRHRGPALGDARQAAVALVIYPTADASWCFPLTRRPQHLRDHGGQVSLPGGSCDPGETSLDCSIREFREELGIDETVQLEHLGQLSPLYIFATNFLVTPHVFASERALDFIPNPAEVEEVFAPETGELLTPESVSSMSLRLIGADIDVPCWQLGGFRVWGATAMILSEWAEVLHDYQ